MANAQHELRQGQAFQQAGRRSEAQRCYQRALALDPANRLAPYFLGTLALADGQPAQAVRYFQQALVVAPDFLEASAHLAATLQSLGQLDDAIAAYRRTLALKPDFAEAHCNLGNALHACGDLPAAIASYRAALHFKPTLAEAHNSLGAALKAQGQLDDALAAYRAALAAKPDYLSAHVNLALALKAQEKWDDAIAASRHALALDPRHTPALLTLGAALEAQGQHDAARRAYEEILQHEPNHADALCNLGIVCQAQEKLDDALAAYERALALQPDHVEALTNLGTFHQSRNDLAAATACYRRALALRPDLGQTRFNEAICHLLAGDFHAGWSNYEYRWQGEQRKFRRTFSQPLWLGDSPLVGQTLLVYPEQGFGDTLQFVRYVPLLAARGARVVLEVQPPLRTLLDGFPGASAVVARGEPLPAFDLHCPLLSLPLAFSTGLETIPAATPYLHASEEKIARWGPRLAAAGSSSAASSSHPTARKIGVVWSGGRHHKTDRLRSIPLEQFKRLFDVSDAARVASTADRAAQAATQFVCLQQEVKPDDARLLAATPGIVSFADEIADFTDTAAIVAQLDLVIAVDTAVAHLAGAMGKPTWILLPFAPDWRWMLGRTDSPWYPSARLFRQPAPGDWESVLENVRTALSRTGYP